jgi:hypothetical protein
MGKTKLLFVVLFTLVSCVAASAQEDSAYDFKINKAFMDELFRQNSVQFKVTGTTIDHSGVHALGSDCEMHIAASPQSIDFGSPDDFVVEPPNECKIPPAGTTSDHLTVKKLYAEWISLIERTMFDGKDQNGELRGRKCTFTGFPRIFTEHAQTGGENASNPDHVFEIHPLLSADCGGSNHFSWDASTITTFSGMRKITPGSADTCIRERELDVRVDADGNYLFRESGANGKGGRCGNFAVVEIMTVDFLKPVTGGHSAIARVSANGDNNETLKIYTFAGTEMDAWITKNSGHIKDSSRMYAHGLFTYDYFQVKKLIDSHTDLSKWTKLQFPIAFVIYGEADAAPWQENSDENE